MFVFYLNSARNELSCQIIRYIYIAISKTTVILDGGPQQPGLCF